MSAPNSPADRQVQVVARDLVFRSKVESVLRSLGWDPVPGLAQRAVIELADDAALARVGTLCAGGVTVIAFGPHVEAARLRAARDAGATAVPNSGLEEAIREVLGPAPG